MRIWSLHPKYLDAKGLVALWRETLLAKHVLQGKTKGYTHHPQLSRFKLMNRPVEGIDQYLSHVYVEAIVRGYNFDRSKIDWDFTPVSMTVTSGQLKYEVTHLLNKLKTRDAERYHLLLNEIRFTPHPLFQMVQGDIEVWEVLPR